MLTRPAFLFQILCLLFVSSSSFAVTTNYRVDLSENTWYLHTDKTYELDSITKATPLTKVGVDTLANTQITFFPDKDKVDVVEAYVVTSDGTHIPVPKGSIVTRPSALSISASGFTNSMVTTIIFPQLDPGAQTVVHWKKTHFKADDYGINILDIPPFAAAVTEEKVIVHKPNALNLYWGKRGNYIVTTAPQKDGLVITATLMNKATESEETHITPDDTDFQSVFVASTTPSWKDVGRIYYQLSIGKDAVTPEIRALAKQIVGDKTGLAAAKALYNWTEKNIHYVSLGLNEASGYTPHSATEILSNRYGDCKDYSILLQTLFKAVGIKSYTALIDWGGLFAPLPVPILFQFNHAIVYLPDYRLFVNSTGDTAGFGILDTALLNKMAIIASEKGQIAYTPLGNPADNQYSVNNEITLDDNGNITGSGTLQSTGIVNNFLRAIVRQNPSMQKVAETLLANTPEGGTGTLSPSDANDLDRDMVIQTTWRSPSAVSMHNHVYLSTPYGIALMQPSYFRNMAVYEKRLYPALISGNMTATWHYTIHLPLRYQVESLPTNVTFNNTAGTYSSAYQLQKNAIDVMRKLTINRSYYRPEEYADFNELALMVANDAKSMMVLVRKNS